jgi:Holliday junction resolvasome RuvABC endonuclease subunit
MSRLVFGIDISLTATGLCAASGLARSTVGSGLTVETASIRVGTSIRGPARLATLSRAIWQWMQARQEARPGDLYVVEGYAFSRSHAHSMGEIGGCVRKLIWESGGNLLIVPPSVLKKFVTGKGAGEKSAVIKHVYQRWGFDSDDDDQCDAFGCAVIGLLDRMQSKLTEVERAMLDQKVERWGGRKQTWGKSGAVEKAAKKKS